MKLMSKIKSILISLGYIGFVIAVWYFISSYLVDKESVRAVVSSYGLLAPFVFIFIQIFQNVFAPVAHYPILLAGGFVFGGYYGFILNWVGTSIGTILIILLARRFGRPLVNKMVSQRFIEKYDKVVNKMGPFVLFLIYLLPVFPDDEISYLVGLSLLPLKTTAVAIILGKMGGACLSFFGDNAGSAFVPSAIMHVISFTVAVLYFFRKQIFRNRFQTLVKTGQKNII